MEITYEQHFPEGSGLSSEERMSMLREFLNANMASIACGVWDGYERRGRGMLVLSMDDVASEAARRGHPIAWQVAVPYHTKNDIGEIGLRALYEDYFASLLGRYDPESEVLLLFVRPNTRMSVFIVRPEISPPKAASFKNRMN